MGIRMESWVHAAILLGLFTIVCRAGCWSELKDSHQLKRLSLQTHAKLVALSNEMQFKQLLQPLLVERVSGTEANQLVQDVIKDHMKSLGWTIKEDPFQAETPIGQFHFNNIVATQNPLVRRQLTLACHFDSKYFDDSEVKFVAATDSAVPCAMIIELAQLLNASLWRGNSGEGEDISLQLIFFDGEEAFRDWTATDSLYGSRHLCNKWSVETHPLDHEKTVLDGMDVLVLLDLIGTHNPAFHDYFPVTSRLFQQLSSIEVGLRERGQLPKRSTNFFKTGAYRGGIEDDHLPFMRKGVHVLHLIPSPFPHVWHQKDDNEAALDYSTIDDISVILRVFVAQYLHLSL